MFICSSETKFLCFIFSLRNSLSQVLFPFLSDVAIYRVCNCNVHVLLISPSFVEGMSLSLCIHTQEI
jgi:hypothetical protein